jgi:sodium-dependent dicarboxylate transporter 2/3/5
VDGKLNPDSVESIGDGIVVVDQVATAHAAMSEGERRFEHLRRTWGFYLGPLAFAGMLLIPTPGLSDAAHVLAAIVTLVVVWWITEPIPIPVTALLGAGLTVILGVAPAAEAFAPFASPTIFLFIGSFIIGRAVEEHGLDQRLATALLAVPAIGRSLTRTRMAIAGFVIVVSAWMSNTATAAMMVPLALGILSAQRGLSAAGPYGPTSLLLVVAFAASIGGMATPVGSPPNLITLGLLDRTAGIRLNFLTWMVVAVPISIAMGALLVVVAGRKFPLPRERAHAEQLERPPRHWTVGQRNCAIAFFTAVVLWVTPGALSLFAPDAPFVKLVVSRLDEAVVAVLAAVLLFVLPIDWKRRQFTLDWRQAASIDWGTILLFGGGLSLGRLMFETGLAASVGNSLVELSGATSLWGITALAIVMGILLTEITSNTAAANMLVPVVISISQAAGVSPIPPSLGAAFGASMAFMLPISTPPNAIVYGTGLVPIRAMLGFGVIMDVLGAVIIFAGLRILCPLLGLA